MINMAADMRSMQFDIPIVLHNEAHRWKMESEQ